MTLNREGPRPVVPNVTLSLQALLPFSHAARIIRFGVTTVTLPCYATPRRVCAVLESGYDTKLGRDDRKEREE